MKRTEWGQLPQDDLRRRYTSGPEGEVYGRFKELVWCSTCKCCWARQADMYFPRLYPDELIYSAVARCRVHLGWTAIRAY